MATQNVNVGINISDNGTAKKVIKNVDELHSKIKATQKSAEKMAAPKAGYKASTQATGVEAQLSNQEYNRGRGSMGATGASARDFANQAQGLGGLVRLYATYAANVFAVGAAFRALTSAMDTANLVRGLDQLGASSGTALGSLSKRLVQATDGAISLREAMESTAKASSSGMSSENILRMGKVAKQASQALGVDMADAVNRLTRGITKLEPELLDELGIFTKVDKATEEYAKTIGKSTSAITDFEKRMAFANAVLAEGEQKFNAIDFETNPYTKLLATLKDVAQSGLELVNKVLGPLVKFLSESPTALATAMTAIGVSLVRQALPAIGQMREGLRSNAQEALKAAETFKASFGDEFQELLEKRFRIPDLEAGVRKAQRDLNSLKVPTNIAQSVKNLASDTATAADLKNAQEALKTRNRIVESGMRGTKAASEVQIKAAKEEIAYIKQSIALYERKQAVSQARVGTEVVANLEQGPLDPQILALKRYEKLRAAVDRSTAISNAAQNAQIAGIRGSWALLNQEISEKGITGFSRFSTLVRGGLAAVGTRIMGVISAFNGVAMGIGAGVAAFTLLDSLLTNSSKEMADFSTAAETATESIANLNRTLDAINKKPFGKQLETASLKAIANAVNEISLSLGGLIKQFNAVKSAQNGWDRFVDSIKGIVGQDIKSKLARNLGTTIYDALNELDNAPGAEQARKNIAAILKIDPEVNKAAWVDAVGLIADNKTELDSLTKAFEEFQRAQAEVAGKAEQFDTAMKKSKEALRDFTNEYKLTDKLTILALSIADTGKMFADATKDPEKAIGRLKSIIDDPKQFGLFAAEDQQNLVKYTAQIEEINKAYEKNKRKLEEVNKEVKNLRRAYTEIENLQQEAQAAGNDAGQYDAQKKQLADKLAAGQARLQAQQSVLDSSRLEVVGLINKFPQMATNQLIKGADLLSTSIAASFAKGTTSFTNAVLSSVGDLPGTAQRRYEMEMRKLNSEAELLKVQAEMLKATHLNTLALRIRNAQEEKAKAETAVGISDGADTGAVDRLKKASKELQDLLGEEAIYKLDPSQALKAVAMVKTEILNGNAAVRADSNKILSDVSAMAGIALSQRNNIDAKATANYNRQLGIIDEQYGVIGKIVALDKEKNSAALADLAISKAKNGALTEAESNLERQEKILAANLDAATKNLAIAKEIDRLEIAKNTGKISVKDADKRIQQLGEQAINNALIARQEIEKTNLEFVKEQLANKKQLFDEEQRLYQIQKAGIDAQKEAQNKVLNTGISTAKQTETYSPEFQLQQEAELAAINARYQQEKDLIALRDEQKQKSFELSQQIQLLEKTATTEEGKRRLDALKAEQEALGIAYTQREEAINKLTQTELDSIAKIEAARQETKAFDNLIAGIKSLEGAFAGLGNGLSSTVQAFRDADKSQKQYANNISKLQSDLMVTKEGSKDYAEIEKKLAKERNLQAKAEITNYGNIAGAAKSMFKEKSTGYKILAGIEKVMHITRLAMDVAEMVSDTTKTATTTANSATRTGATIVEAGVDAVAAVIKAISSLPPPLNYAAGAATAAIVGSLMSQIGGSGPDVAASTAGFTAEDRQQTQGTGMSWVNGTQVENGGGVFGDPTEKLDSINKGIELLNANTIDGLYYDNRMVKAMEAVAQSMTGVATALFAIPGITSGLNFGTQSGSWASGGGIINSIFGGNSSTTRAIEDVGVQLRGSLETLIASQFKDIVTTVSESGGWFGSDSTYTTRNREIQSLGNDINAAFIDIFKGAKDMFTEIGDLVGISAQTVTDVFRATKINLDISLKGLSGTETLDQINAVISSQLDAVSKILFSSFEPYRKFGEGYTDTVIRVVDSNLKVASAVSAMGLATDGLAGNFEATERVIKNMAGSLEQFTEQAKFFLDNFLTEVERTKLIRDSVQQSLADMGLPIDLTRDQFKQLVQMQDLTTETGRIMYQGLMDIQQSFYKTTERLADLEAQSKDLEIELLKAAGATDAATAALDAIATEGMTAAELAAYNYNKALQATIDAIQEAQRVEEQKISIEQKIAQAVGDLVATRAYELEKLDESNRQLQVNAWAVEDYTKAIAQSSAEIEKAIQLISQTETAIQNIQNKATDAYISASDKVAQAQKTIADLAVEAAKKMQEFGKSLRDFVNTELSGTTQSSNAMLEFSRNIASAIAGDTIAIQNVPELARAAIDAAKATATSSEQFNAQRAAILGEVIKVAKSAEDRAAQTVIPVEIDPLVAANAALEEAIIEQTKALQVANEIGASLVKAPEDLVALYQQATLDLADAIQQKTILEEQRAAQQKALDDIVGNTGRLIEAIRGSTAETVKLAEITAGSLNTLDQNLDGKLTYDELVAGLKDKASDDQIKALIKTVDLNNDAVLDSYELELFNSTKAIVDALGSGFSLIDTNLDGKVSEAEFLKAMTGKASDSVLKTIFNLIDGDNDKIITATETTAAKSALINTNTSDTADFTEKTISQLAFNAISAAADTVVTTDALTDLNNANLLTITNNTATTVQGINKLLTNNDLLFDAMNKVAKSTSALADAVKPGSGAGSVTSSGGANNLLGIFGKTVDTVGNIVDSAVSAVGNVVSGVANVASNVVSSVGNAVSNVVSGIFGGWSDVRIKQDITPAARLANGISLYDFTYKAPYSQIYGSDRKRGVLAQEVMGDYPEAVHMASNGIYWVDYSKLPIPSNMLKFATGGVFSNNIITRPTGFELGMMGEAGPEAVMPLSRTSSGKLGVIAQTAPVDNTTREMLKQNAALVAEVKGLREEVNLLRFEARSTATATTKTNRLLERVTQNGDSLLVTDTATV